MKERRNAYEKKVLLSDIEHDDSASCLDADNTNGLCGSCATYDCPQSRNCAEQFPLLFALRTCFEPAFSWEYL
jgi:hypothetical protein